MSGISAAAWIAIGAAALSVVALAFAIAFFVQLRRVRRAQKVMLGNGTDDLVVSAPYAGPLVLDNSGEVFVFDGATHALMNQ